MAQKFDYNRSIATANRLIARFGQAGAVVRTTQGGSEWDPDLVETEYPCTLCDMGYSTAEVDGQVIHMGDRNIYVAVEGLPIVPTPADKLRMQGELWGIADVKPLRPAGIDVFYEVQARR